MTRRLTLHVGQTKAGSTSLQNWLDGRRGELAAQGALFPASVFARGNPDDPERTPGHLALLRLLDKGETGALEAELAARPEARLVLSAENLFSDRPDAALERLGAYFRGWEVEILAVLRPQLDWLRSRHREDVMSGFHCATRPLPELARAVWESGALDYHGRLRRLAGLLGAARVRALRFDDAAGRPLVPRLLEALALAPDARGQAAQMHANRRERDDELLEAKRRLNGLTRGLPVAERLRIEHELRRLARDTPAAGPFGGAFGGAFGEAFGEAAPTGLDAVQLAALQAGNDALLAEGILDQPLPVGRPDAAPAGHSGRIRASRRTRALLEAGLELAARIAWQDPDRARLAGTLPGLTRAQIAALQGALGRHPVSLHLEAAAGATLAATGDGALAVLLTARPDPWAELARLDATRTAAPLVALPLSGGGPGAETGSGSAPDLPALLHAHHLPPPGLLVVGADCPAALAGAALAQLHPQEVFLWPGASAALGPVEALCAGGWSGYAAGEALLLRRRGPAPGQAPAPEPGPEQTQEPEQERAG